MRLGSVLSEALRNIGSGVSRAFAMFLAVLLSGTLLGGYEATTVIDLESQAVQRINAYVDVNAIVGGTVDGTACDRLSDAGDGMTGTLAGAMRAGEQVVPLATPGKDISSYDVTPGMIRLIAGNAKADVSGVWVPRDVFLNNREALLEMLARFSEDAHALGRTVRYGQAEFIEDRIRRGRKIRRELIERKQA